MLKKMEPLVKKLWVEALRSGNFQQGSEQLYKNGRYCCLGVLCELHRQVTGRGKWSSTPSACGGFTYQTEKDESGAVLPMEVREWAGLDEANPVLAEAKLPSVQQVATFLNDGQQLGFPGIADYIEANR
jgi:hypothetical protein